MMEFYGHKWASMYGETFEASGSAGLTWQKGLAGVVPGNLADGLRKCLDREDPWPPTLPEFRKLCLPPEPAGGEDWKSQRADKGKMPGPQRLQWHKDNIAHVEAGGTLPRNVPEPRVWE